MHYVVNSPNLFLRLNSINRIIGSKVTHIKMSKMLYQLYLIVDCCIFPKVSVCFRQ